MITLQWRHNERDGVSNQQRLDCLFNRLFRRISKKTSKLRVTGLCEGNPPVIDGFPSQRISKLKMFPSMTSSWYPGMKVIRDSSGLKWTRERTSSCIFNWIMGNVTTIFNSDIQEFVWNVLIWYYGILTYWQNYTSTHTRCVTRKKKYSLQPLKCAEKARLNIHWYISWQCKDVNRGSYY